MRFVCVDFGSTYTKAALVSEDGDLLGTTSHRTTIDTDVLDGLNACLDALGNPDAEVLACSSAGGGLRIAVVGNEELVTAEAGRRVALSSGGRVVSVTAGPSAAPPDADVVLLTGGTDGGNSEVLLECARALQQYDGPIVVAGNIDAPVSDILHGNVVVTENVMPRIGVLNPEPARAAIRAMFIDHVIGGRFPGVAELVRGATPDVVLTAVELLADEVGDVVVVDVGGATTDVHSVVDLDPDSVGHEVVATTRVTRTVEGDLGTHWSADSTRDAAREAGLSEHTLAAAAIALALRRHAGRSQVAFSPEGRVVERTGKNLREVGLLIGSGGALRYAPDAHELVTRHLSAGAEGGWQLPEHPRVVVDTDYVLAAAGLLAPDHPEAARRLLNTLTRQNLTSQDR